MNIAIFFISFGLLIPALIVHELAHGWVAYRLGDSTAKYSGRLTLNPLSHIDPFWTVILPLVLFIFSQGRFVFGSAKPVPVNYANLKNPKRDMIFIGAAGPLANFILAWLLSFFWKAMPVQGIASSAVLTLLRINVFLGVFNLLPIPPLDGSRIVEGLLPRGLAYRYAMLERFGLLIVSALIFLNITQVLIWPVVAFILTLLGVPL